jgi:hypothetical protein
LEVKDFTQFYFILLPQLLVIGFIFIVPSTIRNVVSEKESGIKVISHVREQSLRLLG